MNLTQLNQFLSGESESISDYYEELDLIPSTNEDKPLSSTRS